MNFRRLLLMPVTATLVITLSGCGSLGKKKKPDDPAADGAKISDQNSDASFQSFLSRLRKAVAKQDMSVLPGMMTSDFGYAYPGGEGAGVYEYWTKNSLWHEVSLVLNQKFVPSGTFMVAPAGDVASPDYNGYIAGLELVNGAWRFAYFVSAGDIRKAAAASAQSSPAPQ